MTAAIIFFFLIASVQIGRFLAHERFVQMEVSAENKGASVYLDGQILGKMAAAKQIFPNITAGEHNVEIRGSSDQGIHHEVLYFKPGDMVQINANLPERNTVVTLWASSEPQGAAVYFDDQLLGNTPLRRLRLKSGTHKIKVEKEGYAPVTDQINLEKSQTYTFTVNE